MGLVGVGQLPAALHRGKIHLVRRQLKALVQHGGDEVKVPGGQHRGHPLPHEGVQRGEHHIRQGIIQRKDAGQFPVHGAEHRVFHMHALGQGNFHQIHKGGRAHQHLVAPDIGGQSAALVAAQVVRLAEDAALGPHEIVKQLGQTAARVPDQGGGVAHHPLNGVVSKDLDAVELYIARGKQVAVGDDHPVALPGLDHSRPSGQGRAALSQAAGHLVEGPGIDQASAQGGGGGKGGRQAPQQMLGLSHPHRNHDRQQHAPQQQQGAVAPVDTLGPVIHLDLAAKAVGLPRPLAVGVLAVPLSLVQGEQIGLGRGRGGAAGQAQAALFVVGAVKQEKQLGQTGGGVGQLALPVLGHGQSGGVGQGEDHGQSRHGVHAHPAPEHAAQSGNEHIRRQQKAQAQHAKGAPGLDGKVIQGRQPIKARGGDGQLDHRENQQQKHQQPPQAQGLDALAVGPGQLLGRSIRGHGLGPAQAAEVEGGTGAAGGFPLVLLVGAGDQLLQAAHLFLVHLLGLLEHVVGVVVRFASQVL